MPDYAGVLMEAFLDAGDATDNASSGLEAKQVGFRALLLSPR